MNSANSVTVKSTRKIHSAQKPRRLARKFSQRRRLIGDSVKRRRSGLAKGSGAGTRAWAGVRWSISDLPGLKVDARIDPRVGEIGNQVHHESQQREQIERGEHHRIVAIEHALEAEL